MPYDYYKAAEALAVSLESEGHYELGEKIRKVIDEGFSSTEILMRLRFTLSQTEFHNIELSSTARSMHAQFLSKLKTALFP